MDNDQIGTTGSRAALAGLVFAVLFVIGWLLLQDAPSVDSSPADLLAYYTNPDLRRGSVIAGLYIIPFAAIAFIWFLAALRDRYVRNGSREHTLLSTVHLIAGALFVVSLFSVAATNLALVWWAEALGADDLDIDSLRSMLAFGEATSDIMALRAGAVFILVSTTRAVRSGLFPRWYGAVSMLAAVVMLFAYDAWPTFALVMPLWVVITSSLVLVHRRTIDLLDGA